MNVTDEDRFRYFPTIGECSNCGSGETMYVGETLIDEKCCHCGRIIIGGYLVESKQGGAT